MPTTPHANDPHRPHPEEIKAAIRLRGTTMAELSRTHGYCAAAVGIALTRQWPAVERIVADFLGREPWDLWPDRYDANRQPRRARKTRTKKVRPRGLRRIK